MRKEYVNVRLDKDHALVLRGLFPNNLTRGVNQGISEYLRRFGYDIIDQAREKGLAQIARKKSR
ncbi:MAG: hypothetical protein DMG58_10335 [Acidobacteria bacterium]|nr:MAG: hypothetical protein DMG58_10335 [Acidobacteriota bacterium]